MAALPIDGAKLILGVTNDFNTLGINRTATKSSALGHLDRARRATSRA